MRAVEGSLHGLVSSNSLHYELSSSVSHKTISSFANFQQWTSLRLSVAICLTNYSSGFSPKFHIEHFLGSHAVDLCAADLMQQIIGLISVDLSIASSCGLMLCLRLFSFLASLVLRSESPKLFRLLSIRLLQAKG